MRVLFLAHAYPRHASDPVGSFVGNLAVALRERDVHVTVSAPSAPGLVAFEELSGVPVHRFRYAPSRYETLAYTGTMGAQVRESVAGKAAMLGYLASVGGNVEKNLRAALVHGAAVASFCCEGFGLKRTTRVTRQQIDQRVKELQAMVRL